MGYNARPNKSDKYHQGYYKLVNESKYISNPTQIIYRSSLEYKFCKFVDNLDKVSKWGSEVIGVPYKSFDNKMHTYYVDFYVEVVNENNPTGLDRLLVEVKPHVETMNIINNTPPKKPKKSTPTSLRNWEYALKEFSRNKHKWAYAQEYARIKNMKFIVVTERTINKILQL